jgi:hexokinase
MAADQDLQAYLEPLAMPREKMHRLTHELAAKYAELALNADDQFLATPITKLPTGAERGEFLAIDLGGSNLRVAFINLLGLVSSTGRRFSLPEYDERIEKYCQRSWPIGDNLKDEKAEDLFAWIGDCLAEVIRARYQDVEVWPEEIPLGITFSFPMM